MEDTTLSIEAKRLKVLEDTCEYFNVSKRNADGFTCRYNPIHEKTEGCAIGRLIKDKALCAKFDELEAFESGVDYVFDELPEDLQELGQEFLARLQDLHDDVDNWTETGMSDDGLEQKDSIKNNYCI